MRSPSKNLLIGVALIALSALLLEVSLTRIFAVTMWYYFGFLAIALALMGTAVAAVCCFLFPERLAGEQHHIYMAKFALLFAVSAPAAIAVHMNLDLGRYAVFSPGFFLILAVQLFVLFLAFFAAGMCITIALFRYRDRISEVYFFDLAGASLGSLLVVPLLYWVSAPAIAFGVSAASGFAGVLFAREARGFLLKTLLTGVALVGVVMCCINDWTGPLQIVRVKNYGKKRIQQTEKHKVFEQWSPVSRVAVMSPRKRRGRELMTVTNDGGAPTALHRFDGDYAKASFLKKDSRQIVHHLKSDAETLVIGSGGGIDVLTALAFNQKRVTAVEINPVIGELVSQRYANYIGRIFEDPRATLHIHEGRNFVAGSQSQYDIIQITMIDSWAGAAAGAYIFNENTLYTKEAVRDYETHLKPDGILSITRYYTWDEALRLTNMIVAYLEDTGLSDAGQRIIVVLEKRKNRKDRRATVLLKNGHFSADESSFVLQTAKANGYNVIYAPHVAKTSLYQSGYASLFRSLIQADKPGKRSRTQIAENYHKNISPPTDDQPFFFFTSYFRDAFHPDKKNHASRRLAMPVLYGTFIIFGLFGLLTIFLPLTLSHKANIRAVPSRLPLLTYFACLGVGFMLIELSLIHRLTVFLGHPTYSFVVVLTALLCASGIGSWVSGRWSPQANRAKLSVVLIGVVGLVAAYVAVGYDQFIDLMWLDKPLRILLAVLAIAPPAFLLGMCFPMGMRIAQGFHDHLIPWGWGVNGAFSVFGSILSLMLALHLGLKATLAIGGACYGLALILILGLGRAPIRPTEST